MNLIVKMLLEGAAPWYHGTWKTSLGDEVLLTPNQGSGLLFLTRSIRLAEGFSGGGIYECFVDTAGFPTLEDDVNGTVSPMDAERSLSEIVGEDAAADYVQSCDSVYENALTDEKEPDADSGYIRLYNLIQFGPKFGDLVKAAGHKGYLFTESGSQCVAVTFPVKAKKIR